MQEPTGTGTGEPEAVRRGNPAFQHLADQVDDIADRIDQLIARDQSEGSAARVTSGIARSATTTLDGLADYLRVSDLRSMRFDLEDQVRAKPVKTLLIAVGAGWFLGKLTR